MHLLLVEDDARLAALVQRGLEQKGHTVQIAADGEAGEDAAAAGLFDVLIVDWRLPRQDGRRLVERLRSTGVETPVLMLTAFGDIDHRVAGLDAGADDYLAKPFAFEELFARVRALGRRAPAAWRTPDVEVGPLRLYPSRMEARLHDAPLDLRTKEWQTLLCLAERAGSVVTRLALAERVWGSPYTTDNVIGVTVSGVRAALAAAGTAPRPGAAQGAVLDAGVEIETVRGVGYRLVATP